MWAWTSGECVATMSSGIAPPVRLSKSKFVTGLQCHKRLWWTYHEPDAPELVPDAATQAVFDAGRRVGERARLHYPGGTLVDVDLGQRGAADEAIARTQALIAEGCDTLYEASFRAHGVFVAIDVLERDGTGFVLREVKATLRTKEQHLPDAAVQTWVAREAGLDVVRVELVHLNRDHRHPDVHPLFVADDVTARVEAFLPSIEPERRAQVAMLAGALPDIAVGPHCESPYACPFAGRCTPESGPSDLHRLYQLTSRQAADLDYAGITRVERIPEDFPLSSINRRLRRAVVTGAPVVEPSLAAALAPLEGSVAYLDFETVAPALPAWPGCAPYQKVPVQFSVHRRRSADGALEHVAFLAEGPDDPRPALARALLDATQGCARIAAYNAPFEVSCIRGLAHAVPELAGELHDVVARLVDLLPVVRAHVGHADFGGSFSLKAVAPALLGRGYEGLDVADGSTAANLLETYLLAPETLAGDAGEVRASLLAYCARDTEVLAELHQALRTLAEGGR